VTPLEGVTVVVTRPAAQAGRFAALLHEAGATPLLLPALEIEPLTLDGDARARLGPDDYDWTVFTSANAVEFASLHLPRPGRTRVAAVGRGTARALAEHGIAVQAVPEKSADSEGLLALAPFAAVRGQRILILKGRGGRPLLANELSRRGAEVVCGDLYRRVAAVPDADALDALRKACGHPRTVIAITSVDGLSALLGFAPDAGFPRLRDVQLLVPGQRVAAAARERGWRGPVLVAESAEDGAMFQALVAPGAASGRPAGAA
jgi:uroporphyrinogen-III synthase